MNTRPMQIEELLGGASDELCVLFDALRAILKGRRRGFEVVELLLAGWGIVGYKAKVGRELVYFAYLNPKPSEGLIEVGFQRGVEMEVAPGLLGGRGTQIRFYVCRVDEDINVEELEGLLDEAFRAAQDHRATKRARGA